MSKLLEIKESVMKGKAKLIVNLVESALADGVAAPEILGTMVDTMSEVGEKFSSGEIFVPEMLIAAKAMQKGLEVLKPQLAAGDSSHLGKCIIGTVSGDMHDIGKNLVSIMIEAVGFELIDLGVDVSKEKFINAIEANPDTKIVALSALLTTTMPAMEETIKAIRESGLTGFKIIVGGAPITQSFADKIGADGYSPDAGCASLKAKELVGCPVSL